MNERKADANDKASVGVITRSKSRELRGNPKNLNNIENNEETVGVKKRSKSREVENLKITNNIENNTINKETVGVMTRSKARELNEKMKSNNNIENKENENVFNHSLRKYGMFNANGKRTLENMLGSDEDTDDESYKGPSKATSKRLKKHLRDGPMIHPSQNSGPERKICSICLEPVRNSATIIECDHEFCFGCIEKWVELSSVCPLCRIDFTKIAYFDSRKNKRTKIIEKKEFTDFEYEEEFWYDNSSDKCMVCKNSNNTHLMLVCDSCNYNVCHTYCTNLDKIPDGDWLCEECIVDKYTCLRKSKKQDYLKRLNEESEDEEEKESKDKEDDECEDKEEDKD